MHPFVLLHVCSLACCMYSCSTCASLHACACPCIHIHYAPSLSHHRCNLICMFQIPLRQLSWYFLSLPSLRAHWVCKQTRMQAPRARLQQTMRWVLVCSSHETLPFTSSATVVRCFSVPTHLPRSGAGLPGTSCFSLCRVIVCSYVGSVNPLPLVISLVGWPKVELCSCSLLFGINNII